MYFTVRSSASFLEELSEFQAAGIIRTGINFSARAEAISGSTAEIHTGISFTAQYLLVRPIRTGIVFRATAYVQSNIATRMQFTATAATADFGFSRDLVAARQVDLVGETLANFVMIGQLITDPTLKTEANGGRIKSASANDIQFTTEASAPLIHNIVSYGPATGAFMYDLKLTNWAAVTADYRHRMFYSRSEITSGPMFWGVGNGMVWGAGNAMVWDTAEADPTVCFSHTAAVWLWPSGSDISGNDRNLTTTGVVSGTLKGPAGVFETGDRALLANPLFAALSNCAVEFWARPTAIGRIMRIGPTTVGSSPGLDIRIDAEGWASTKRTAAGAQVSTGAAAVTFDVDYHVVAVFADGVNNAIWVNGAPISLTHGTVARAGAISVLATDELAIGDPTPTDRTGFAGTLGRVIFWPFAPSATWIKISYRIQADQIAVVGLGAENILGVANRSPVAIPMDAAAAVGSSVDVDVAGRAYDPEGNLLTASVPVAPTQGISTIVSNKVRYTPQGGTGGQIHTVPFQVADASLTSRSIIRVSVTAPSTTPEWPSPIGFNVRTVNSSDDFAAAYADSQPGDHVIVADGVNLGARTLNRAGTTANPIVIRGATNQAARFGGTLTLSASNQYLWGFQGIRFRCSNTPSRITMRRVHFTGDTALGYIADEVGLDFLFQFCTVSNSPGGIRAARPSFRWTFSFCHWLNIAGGTNGTEPLAFRAGFPDSESNGGFILEDSLFENCLIGTTGENETVSTKISGSIMRRLDFVDCRDFTIRLGNNNRIEGVSFRATENGFFSIRGRGNVLNNCLGTIILRTGNVNSALNLEAVAGSSFGNSESTRIIGGGNSAQTGGDSLIQLGDTDNRTFKAVNTIVEGRGSTPNVTQLNNGGNGASILPTTSVPLILRPAFPRGQGVNNMAVGVRGGL